MNENEKRVNENEKRVNGKKGSAEINSPNMYIGPALIVTRVPFSY